MMRNEEKVVFKSARLAYNAYKKWRRKEKELIRKLGVYLENLREIYIQDKKISQTIYELEDNLVYFKLRGNEKASEAIMAFFNSLTNIISIEEKPFVAICQELDNLKMTWQAEMLQGLDRLDYMRKMNMELQPKRCNISLLLLLTQYCYRNRLYFYDEGSTGLKVIKNITYSKYKPYSTFCHVFKNHQTVEEEFERFWEEELPEYIQKRQQ